MQLIGNHDGLGEIRKKELIASCKMFGIRESNVLVLEREYVYFFNHNNVGLHTEDTQLDRHRADHLDPFRSFFFYIFMN